MLSMIEVNQMLKENFQRQLQDVKDLPEDLARGYKAWVRGLVRAASQQIAAAQATQQEQGQQGQPEAGGE